MKLLRTKSMIRYLPPKGTAGLARSRVRGNSRVPLPPASTTPNTRMYKVLSTVKTGSCLAIFCIGKAALLRGQLFTPILSEPNLGVHSILRANAARTCSPSLGFPSVHSGATLGRGRNPEFRPCAALASRREGKFRLAPTAGQPVADGAGMPIHAGDTPEPGS